MKKKWNVLFRIIVTLVILAIIGLFTYMFSYKPPVVELPDIDTEVNIDTEVSVQVPEVEYTEPEQDRELKFDNIVGQEFTKEDYKEKEDVITDPKFDSYYIYDFSNGFAIQESENIRFSNVSIGALKLIGADTANIYVKEIDSSETSVQELRRELLCSFNYDYHVSLDCRGIPLNAEFDEEKGLDKFGSYYEGEIESQFTTNPTIGTSTKLVSDTILDVSYGNALTIVLYAPAKDNYILYSFVQCDGGRILEIAVSNTTREYAISYLYEITNDVITLIE